MDEQQQPTEEELRAAFEAQLAEVHVGDVIAQTIVSLINLGARRGGLTGAGEEEHDLGEPGKPFERHHPFYIGFFGGFGALLAFWLGSQVLAIRSVLVLIVVALFLAAGLNPAVEFFVKRGLKRSYAVLCVILGVLVALALFVMAIVPVISDQVASITANAPRWLDQLQQNQTVQELDEKYGVIETVNPP